MDKNMPLFPPEYPEQSEYQTGFTQPPKQRNGLIAFLLVVIILLSSVISVLGMMNVHLFRQLDALSSQSTAPVRFSEDGNDNLSGTDSTDFASDETTGLLLTPIPGISGYVLSEFEQTLYHLPQGFCVTQADTRHPLVPGDILLSLDGVAIDSADTLSDLLNRRLPGNALSAVIYRDGEQHSISISVSE